MGYTQPRSALDRVWTVKPADIFRIFLFRFSEIVAKVDGEQERDKKQVVGWRWTIVFPFDIYICIEYLILEYMYIIFGPPGFFFFLIFYLFLLNMNDRRCTMGYRSDRSNSVLFGNWSHGSTSLRLSVVFCCFQGGTFFPSTGGIERIAYVASSAPVHDSVNKWYKINSQVLSV